MRKRKEPKSNKPRHNHKQEGERGRREGRRGQGWSMPQLQPRIAIVQLSGVQWGADNQGSCRGLQLPSYRV